MSGLWRILRQTVEYQWVLLHCDGVKENASKNRGVKASTFHAIMNTMYPEEVCRTTRSPIARCVKGCSVIEREKRHCMSWCRPDTHSQIFPMSAQYPFMVMRCEFLLSSRSAAGLIGLLPVMPPAALLSFSANSCLALKVS